MPVTEEMAHEVLVIEDDAITLMHVTSAISAVPGLHATGASNARDAIAAARNRRPDVIVADVMVGEENGLQTAVQISASAPCPIIVTTAVGDDQLNANITGLPRFVVMAKPLDMDRLITEIKICLKYASSAEAEVDSEFLLATLYDTARIGMCVTDADRRFVRVNRAYCEHYGYSRDELIGNEFVMVLPETDRTFAARIHDEFIAAEIPEIPARWRVRRKSGEIREIFVTAGRFIGTDGRPYKVTTVSDVTDQIRHEEELARALEEKRILLREVHHRVKNNLNTLSALLDLQRQHHAGNAELADLLTVSINRVRTMSRIYERLNDTDSDAVVRLDDYVGALARDLTVSGEGTRVSVATSIEPITTDIDRGISAGLIVNELVTNAVKHATKPDTMSTVSVSIVQGEAGLTIDVEDDGPGFPEGFSIEASNTLGLQLVQAVAGQRGGTVEVVDGPHGHVRVIFPV